MGLTFSFSLIAESKQVDLVLRELASLLSERDALRLNEAIPWKPEIQHNVVWGSGKRIKQYEGIRKLKRNGGKVLRNVYYFSFVFPVDAELKAYEERCKDWMDLSIRGDKIEIGGRSGCISTSLHVGTDYALLQSTAELSDMSELFRSSRSIRDSWIGFASRSKSLALFFDSEEDYDWFLLYPQTRKTKRPEIDCFCSEDFKILRADKYCWEALHLSMLI
jgi:hypothetical protein